MDEGILKWKRT